MLPDDISMQRATLRRTMSTICGVLGRFDASGFCCYTLELPWRDNEPNVSCIPAGVYTCTWIRTPHHGWVYQVDDVPGRGGILLHPGNYAGTAPCVTHSRGCILPGLRHGVLAGQFAVLNSVTAARLMADAFGRKPFHLHVVEVFDV